MSKYTTQVRFICETAAGLKSSVGASQVMSVVKQAAPIIFSSEWPIFDDEYRAALEEKILLHYYTREIAFETVSLWMLKLNIKMGEIMPYYNQLYKTTILDFNPLYDTQLERKHKLTRDENSRGTNTSASSSTGHSTNLGRQDNTTTSSGENRYSDTPEGQVNLANAKDNAWLTNITLDSTDAKNNTTVSNLAKDNSRSNTIDNTSNKVHSLDDYIETVSGYSGGNLSEKVAKFRENIINIDMMIINELEDLFFSLW